MSKNTAYLEASKNIRASFVAVRARYEREGIRERERKQRDRVYPKGVCGEGFGVGGGARLSLGQGRRASEKIEREIWLPSVDIYRST